MAETYSVRPGAVDLEIERGDEFNMSVSFNRDLSNYTVSATIGDFVAEVEPSNYSADNTDVLVRLQEVSVAQLPALTTWRMWWVAPGTNTIKRTVLAGDVRVYDR